MNNTKTRLRQFLTAIGARDKLAQDEAEDWIAPGKFGVVHADSRNPNRFHIVFGCPAGPSMPSEIPLGAQKARAIRERLSHVRMELNHTGDIEFSYKLDRLPTSAEAERFRDALGLAKKIVLSEERKEELRARMATWRKEEA